MKLETLEAVERERERERGESLEAEKNNNSFQSTTYQNCTNVDKFKQRQSNFELLRIICMILIIMHHYTLYSGFELSQNITLNKLIIRFLCMGGKISVNIFVIITGYFMINSKFKIKKVINLILQTFTYSIFFGLINLKNVQLTQVAKILLPITYSQYWFITTYIFLYILSPFINKLLKNLDKKEHGRLLIILLVVESIIPTFLNADSQFSNIAWFINLYMLGAYINKYCNEAKMTIKKDFLIAISNYLLIFMSIVILDILSMKYSILIDKTLYFTSMNTVCAVIVSIFVVCAFRKFNFQSKVINYIAGTVLGVYIIHENMFMREVIWKKIVQGAKYINSPYLIINAILGVFFVFVVCAIVEYIRQKLIEPIQNRLIDKISKNKFSND